MGILLTISDLLIPVTVLCIVVFGCLQRMDIYEVFLEGAKEGLQTVLDILPTLIGLMMAVEVMRAGGLLDILVRLIRPAADAVGFPAELAPLSLVRLVSSSAATGLLTDLFAKYGPDSFLGRTASVMMSCTETVFYTMSLYFLSVGIRKTRYTLPCALLANLKSFLHRGSLTFSCFYHSGKRRNPKRAAESGVSDGSFLREGIL